jgi:small-conductance mechanosensitive channel
MEILKRVAADQPGVTKEPASRVYVVNFAASTVTFNLRAWAERYEDWVQVRSDLSVAVDEALVGEKITVA